MNSQRLCIVTGSSKGLGLEICKQLVKLDYTVLGISRSESKINNDKYFHLIQRLHLLVFCKTINIQPLEYSYN